MSLRGDVRYAELLQVGDSTEGYVLFYFTILSALGKVCIRMGVGVLTLIFLSFFCCVLVFHFVLVCHILVVTGSYLHL